jgi:hypothetical protein
VPIGLFALFYFLPDSRHSAAPEGDAITIANLLREHGAKHDMPAFADGVPLAELPSSPAQAQVRSSTGR